MLNLMQTRQAHLWTEVWGVCAKLASPGRGAPVLETWEQFLADQQPDDIQLEHFKAPSVIQLPRFRQICQLALHLHLAVWLVMYCTEPWHTGTMQHRAVMLSCVNCRLSTLESSMAGMQTLS